MDFIYSLSSLIKMKGLGFISLPLIRKTEMLSIFKEAVGCKGVRRGRERRKGGKVRFPKDG